MPVRNIKKSGSSVVGSFPSVKLGKTVRFESTLERDFLYFLEFDMGVLSYEMQPFTAYMRLDDGKIHRYTPDACVFLDKNTVIVEIKAADRLHRAETVRQIAIGEKWASQNCHLFQLITDKQIRQGHRLENLKLLYKYSRLEIPFEIYTGVQKIFSDPDMRVPFGQVSEALLPDDSSRCKSYLWSLIFSHYLETDLDQKLTNLSLLSRGPKGKKHG